MKITKFEHSCLDIRDGESRLVIDPGVYSTSFQDISNITAMVITHVHPDHFDPEKVNAIIAANPEIKIFTTQEVAEQLSSSAIVVATIGQPITIGTFVLEFFGGAHAQISPAYPAAQNIGVLVNSILYYPGDSLDDCNKPYALLAVPTMAPWLKFSEAANFVASSKAQKVFPSHNGFINTDGQALYDRLISAACQQSDKDYTFVAVGESLDI